jgi:hypothetical protein
MRRSDELQEALRVLGEEHRIIGAPPRLESRLRAAVRSRSSAAAGPWIRWRIPAVGAAAVLALLLIRSQHRAGTVEPFKPSADFVVLPASFALPPPSATTIVRLELRKSDLRQYGFDVPPPVESELVSADFVVGEDGLARAVRLIQ